MASEPKGTVSRCTTVTDTGAHTFQIVGYSFKKGIGVGKSYPSGVFTVGGCSWILRFCPNGISKQSDQSWLHLELVSKNTEARAWYEVKLVKASGSTSSGWIAPEPKVFSTRCGAESKNSLSVSFPMKSEQELEARGYIYDDCITVRCVITVIKETKMSGTMPADGEIEVPPPNITAHLRKLLEDKEGTDVTFNVGGESFPAHKVVLAMRSPVFKGQLWGPMRDKKGTHCVTIEDMQPEVFRALLHFIYMDSMPDLADLEGNDYREMIRHLLVAADIYAMDRLKTMCQNILAKNLDVQTVGTTLGLADQHNCDKLKDVCIEFLTSADEDEMKAVAATKGYENLKRSCPSVFVDIFERSKRRKVR